MRITNPDPSLINKRFAELGDARNRLGITERRVARLDDRVDTLAVQREPVFVNNLVFLWDGPNSKVTWVAGFLKALDGEILHIPAGERTGLSASTDYWVAWNTAHRVMAFDTALETVFTEVNIVVGRIQTGGAGATGTAGGGGTSPGGTDGTGTAHTYTFV